MPSPAPDAPFERAKYVMKASGETELSDWLFGQIGFRKRENERERTQENYTLKKSRTVSAHLLNILR